MHPAFKSFSDYPMPDALSVLTHSRPIMSKVWQADGNIKDYGKAKYFNHSVEIVNSIHDLSRLLSRLEHEPRACLIRGRRLPPEGAHIRRVLENFADQPLHTVLIEIDNYRPVSCDPVLDPVGAIEEYITEVLPGKFQGIAYRWQLSNSAGHVSKTGLLKAHVWFWLAEARSSRALEAWADANKIACDKSVFREVQVHYTAAPMMDEGVTNPVPVRSGFVEGLVGDEVCIDIEEVNYEDRKVRKQGSDDDSTDAIKDALIKEGKVIGYGAEGRVFIKCPFSDGHTDKGLSKKDDDTSCTYFPAGTGDFEQGHFCCLHDSCRTGKNDGDFIESLGVGLVEFDDLGPLPLAEVVVQDNLDCELMQNDKNQTLATVTNVNTILMRPDKCENHICYDTFRDEIVWKPFGSDCGWLPFKDTDYTRLRLYLEKTGFLPVGRELIRDVVHHVAVCHKIDSAIEWISSLHWDGVKRIGRFMCDYMGAEASEYATAISEYAWTALAGRALSPGCKADAAIIFVGEQYIGKSFATFSIAADHRLFTNISFKEDEEKLARKMRGKLVAEFAEMKGLWDKDNESLKDFISRQYEEWVPKYVEFATQYPRRLIFFGTSNEEEIFNDETGNRRWFPIIVTKADCEAIARDREQLWAEGKEMFQSAGSVQPIYEKANGLANSIREYFMITDPWEDAAKEWLEENHLLTTCENLQIGEFLYGAFGVDKRSFKMYEAKRAGKILRKFGFTKIVKRSNGILSKVWVKGVPL